MPETASAYLGLGANLGTAARNLDSALERLSEHPDITNLTPSNIIITKPWGKTDQPDFHNMVVGVNTSLPPLELLDVCLGIEDELGRVRAEKWGPRLIDIDIIVYNRVVMNTDRLTLPHQFAHERDFVLDPLREIAPTVADWILENAKGAQADNQS